MTISNQVRFLDYKTEKPFDINLTDSEQLKSPDQLLMTSLVKFYQESDNLDRIVPIINRESKVSLRVIEWFITTYSRDKCVMCPIYDNDGKNVLNYIQVYINYKSTLKSYRGKHFGIFKRSDKVLLDWNNNRLITTIGQLNFFKWAIETQILQFIEKNYAFIWNKLKESKENQLCTKITKNEDNENIELTIEWN